MIRRSLEKLRSYVGSRKYQLYLWLFERFEHSRSQLITFHTRPLYASNLTHHADPLRHEPSVAIVLQGAILRKERFTLESVRMYKTMYPFAKIIVSTWDGEDTEELEREGATVIKSAKPAYYGPFNVNLQITSALAGISEAKRLGSAYVLKCRTDQRMHNRNIFETMTNLLSYFPASTRSGQKKRLLFATGGDAFSPYLLPDMFVFGNTDDMHEYWNAPLVPEGMPNPGSEAIFRPERYLGSTYLAKKGWALDWTVKQMWDIQRECFIALDWSDIDLYWYKYRRFEEYGERKRYAAAIPPHELVGFDAWFNIFSNKENKILPHERTDTTD